MRRNASICAAAFGQRPLSGDQIQPGRLTPRPGPCGGKTRRSDPGLRRSRLLPILFGTAGGQPDAIGDGHGLRITPGPYS